MTHIKWLFFDLGSTLIDETQADLHRIQEMTAGTDVTVEMYYEKRFEILRQGLSGDKETATFFGLTKTPWHSEDEIPYPDTVPTLTELKHRGYKLGIIANQNLGAKERLKKWDLFQYFDVIAISAELGMEKPDLAIFKWALRKADCLPQNAVMVGDRLDNDIVPANKMGMPTIRLVRGIRACQEPQSSAEQPTYTITTLSELLSLIP